MTRTPVAACVLALALAAGPAAGAEPIRMMVPANPGGGWDTTGRAVLNALEKDGLWKAGYQVQNKGGAGGTIGLAEFVSSYKGYDHGMLVMGSVMVGGILTNRSPVTLDQVTPLARLTVEHNGIAVGRGSPFTSVQDLVAALKRSPGAVAVGGGSAGGVDHITLALVARAAGIPVDTLNYVPYQGGGEMIAAVASGTLAAAISGISEFRSYVESGRLRLLAVTADGPVPGVDAPTLRSAGLDVVIGNWRGVVGPPGMSAGARREVIGMLDRMHASASWRETLGKHGWEDAYLSGDAFAAFLDREKARVARVLKDVGLVK